MPSLLIIDDDRAVRLMLERALAEVDVEVLTAADSGEGLNLIRDRRPDTVLLDIVLPGANGLDLFRDVQRLDPKLPVIFMTAGGTSDTAIEAMKLGAYDYVLKPLDLPQVRELVVGALDTRRRMRVPVGLSAGSTEDGPGDQTADLFVGRTEAAVGVYKAIGRVAPQDVTVLIRGESGTGKELVARAIYHHSRRSEGPFVAINCAAIPDALLESELFGHEKGAFTSADSRRIGKFEQCNGGTIFLDEIGDTSLPMQSKMLRLLQEQRFERVGGNQTIETDVRIIAATNRPLERMVEDGRFRGDLFYRLNVFTVPIPPLRDRGDDVLILVEYFLKRFKRELGRTKLEGIAPEAVDLLGRYHWPGNVRELQSVVRKAILHSTGPVIVPKDLPAEVRGEESPLGRLAGPPPRTAEHGAEEPEHDGDAGRESDLAPFLEERLSAKSEDVYAEAVELMERYVVTRVLEQTDGNQSQAARILGITRGSLRNKIRTLGIQISQVVLSEDED